jgi:hypothetical protein
LEVLPTFGAFKVEERISFVRGYDPKVQDIPGFRHAVIRYRNTDSKVVQRTAQMVTVPSITISEDHALFGNPKMQQVVTAVLEDEQDNMIRSQLDQGISMIHWETLTVDKVLDSLTAVRMSQRLTKEQIENWFAVAGKDVCTTRATQISQAKGLNESDTAKQIAGTMTAYKNLAMKLAAPVPNIGENEAKAMKNILILGNLADDMAKVLLAKLEQILNPKIVENTDL